MRIAIMGSGAIGSYYGAKLAKAGYDVTFIARGDHRVAMRDGGLRVEGQEEFHLNTVRVTPDPQEVGPVDLVLFCVKAYDIDAAAMLAHPLVGPQTTVLPLQNGIDSQERIGAVVGKGAVIGGLCRISVAISAPGTVRIVSPFKEIIFGEIDGAPSARTAAIAAVLEKAEIPYRISSEIQVEVWKKFIFITAFSAVTGAAHRPIGPIRESAETLALYTAIAAEAVAVGQAEGVALSDEIPAEITKQARSVAAGMKASLLVDLERGRRTEVETLQGAVVRLGRKHGIATPVTDVIYALLKVQNPA